MAFPEIVQQRASGEDFLGTMHWEKSIEREWTVEKPFQRLGKCWCKQVTGAEANQRDWMMLSIYLYSNFLCNKQRQDSHLIYVPFLSRQWGKP